MIKKIFLKIFIISFFVLTSNSFAVVMPVFKQSASVTDITGDDIGGPADVTLSPDGTKIHFTNFTNETGFAFIRQFTLTTPFDISTMDTSSEVRLNLDAGSDDVGTFVQGHEFNSDGTKVFVISQNGTFNIHTLTTPYDISNFSQDADDGVSDYKTAFSAGDGDVRPRDITFNNDGTKMYFVDGGNNQIADGGVVEYDLSTPFVPSTATFVNELVVTNELSLFEQDVEFDDDGTRMYVIDSHTTANANAKIAVYKLSTPFHTSTATFVGSINNFFNASGGTGTPIGLGFSSDGMKLYQTTYTITGSGDLDRVYEYDLVCPYGIVICETDSVTAIGAQVEIAKNVIHQNSSTIFKRFDWLRRNDERANLTNHEVKLNIHNPILAALKTNLENSLNDIEYTQASLKKENSKINKKNWSYWSHGDISFGRVGDTASSKPKEVKTRGIMFGADKLVDKKIFGYAFRYGNDEVDIDDGSSDELDAQTFSLNIYSSVPLKNRSNLNLLFGASYLMIDQLGKDQVTGNRNGKQIYTSMSYENENEYTKYQLIPFGKLEMGVTQFSDYTDFGVVSNSVESHESLTFKTGNISAGLKFDNILYLNDDTISRNGFIEYIYDLTPNIDHHVKNHIDNTTLKKTINTHSLHNVKGNIGFEYMYSDGRTIAINYERFQSLDKSGHKDSLLIKFGVVKNHNANFDVIYDPINNNNTKISYLKQLGNFNLKLNSNYSLFSKIPDYGANIEISGTF